MDDRDCDAARGRGVRAGALDRQVTVERKQISRDPDFGTETIDWVPLVALPGSPVVGERFWAQVMDALPSHDEGLSQGLVVSRNLTRMRLRYRTDIDSSMRVRLHGDGADIVYQIVGGPANVFKDGRKVLMEIECERYSS